MVARASIISEEVNMVVEQIPVASFSKRKQEIIQASGNKQHIADYNPWPPSTISYCWKT